MLYFRSGTSFHGWNFEIKSADEIFGFECLSLNLEAYPKIFIKHPEITLKYGTPEADFLRIFKHIKPMQEGTDPSYLVPVETGEMSSDFQANFKNGILVSCSHNRNWCSQ
jgi:hypothetical protein